MDISAFYSFANFKFEVGVTPLSEWQYPVFASIGYVLVISLFKLYMKDKPPMVLKGITLVHNLILSVWSLAMFLGITYGALERGLKYGFFSLLCDSDPQPMQGHLAYWCYIYYISKYYELIDTALIVAKKRPLIVLHFWHHAIIGPMSWSWLYGDWTLHWFGAWLNTCIHVFMYYYYFAKMAFNYNPWWKKYITIGQIAQFMTVFVAINVFLYFYVNNLTYVGLVGDHLLPFTFEKGCVGNAYVVGFAQFVNVTFLSLFVNFFLHTYDTKKKSQ
eukprot:TRINITY_DN445_c0_g1_i1.p1 TRINITY_DN445_c0_g1~~TRINITY_DN445_c0_g1_i1.p1  ORF type:complete len:305 (+),score=26.31 TRINITY_DN445_c0_g1_i1:96-917(+)